MLMHLINSYCDRFISPRVRISLGRHSYPAFKVWGCAAFILAAALAFSLGLHRGIPLWAMTLGVALAFASFYAMAMLTKIVIGQEALVFYHQLIVLTLVLTFAAWLLNQPVLLAADIAVTAVGATLTFGRIGCLMVGCCHGRPCRFGVRYSAEHAAEGFKARLVGVRLFPIQIVECLFAWVIVAVGCLIIWNDEEPGAAVGWFVASYCSARFCFEFARWPPSYQFKWGLSQYQWISIIMTLFTISLELGGFMPYRLWHVVVMGLMLLAAMAVILERRLRSFDKDLNHPDHVRELAAAIDSVWRETAGKGIVETTTAPARIPVNTTGLGLQISASRINDLTGDVHHYAISSRRERLTEERADALAKLIARLKLSSGQTEVVKGSRGVFHLLIRPISGRFL